MVSSLDRDSLNHLHSVLVDIYDNLSSLPTATTGMSLTVFYDSMQENLSDSEKEFLASLMIEIFPNVLKTTRTIFDVNAESLEEELSKVREEERNKFINRIDKLGDELSEIEKLKLNYRMGIYQSVFALKRYDAEE